MKSLILVLALLVTLSVGQQYNLKQVQIVTRHGARAPYELFPGDPVVWECKLHPFGSVGTNATDTLKPAGRTYSRQYIPGRQVQPGNCAQGELTSYGRMQHVQLGESVKKMYAGFLPSSYSDKEIYVRSTDVPRTIECAASFLSGLYPETDANVKNINIWLIESDADDLNPPADCNSLNAQCNAAQETVVWEEVLAAMEPLREMLGNKWNLSTSDVPWWGGIRNNIECMQAHNIPLPSYMTNEVVDNINEVATWQLGQIYNSGPRTRLIIGRFLREMRNNINTAASGSNPKQPKFFLYSAHDTTVGPLLGALRAWQDVWPPFASHLHLELYEAASSSGSYFVRGLFNGNVLSFDGCAEYCPLSQFLDVISHTIPSDYDAECNAVPNPVKGISEYTSFMC